jgi:eukaryotic-like serine/threonine-protein kinase
VLKSQEFFGACRLTEVERKQFLVRLEDFELDTRTGELRKNGESVARLSQQPLRLLLALIDRPGELVLREDLRLQLWPDGTVVEFEHSINAAIKRLRQVLGDSPQHPHFIETLTRRGYRWKTSVEWSNGAPASISIRSPESEPAPKKVSGYRVFTIAMAFVALMLAARWIFLRRASPSEEQKLTQLTWNSSEIPVRTSAISPDGKFLAYTDLNGIHIKALSTNEVRTVPQPESVQSSRVDWAVIDWFPDGMEFIAEILPFDEGCAGCDPFSTWVVSLLGGPPRKIRDGSAAESISPDGSKIAYTAMLGKPGGKEIWVMDKDGANPKRIVQTNGHGWLRYAKWSPDGKRMAYLRLPEGEGNNVILESSPVAGGSPVTILRDAGAGLDFTWLPDGNIIYASDEPNHTACNYWRLHVDPSTGQPTTQPNKVTNWAGFCLDWPTKTADGRQLVFIEKANRGAIYISQTRSKPGEITSPKLLSLTEASNQLVGWTADSRSIIFTSDRDRFSGFYSQAIDSDNSERILAGVQGIGSSQVVSPEGKWVLFAAPNDANDPKALTQLTRVPLGGGPAQSILSGLLWGIRCARAPSNLCVLKEYSEDRKSIIFSSIDPSSIDPLNARVRELFRMSSDDDTNWQLSPDGTKIVLFGVQRPMRIRSLRDQSVRELVSKEWAGVDYVTWTNDSNGFFGSVPTQQGDVLLRFELNGKAQKLWESRGSFDTSAMSSPDGKSLAVQSWSIRSNVWVLENF